MFAKCASVWFFGFTSDVLDCARIILSGDEAAEKSIYDGGDFVIHVGDVG